MKKNWIIGVVALVMVLSVTTVVLAQTSFWGEVARWAGYYIGENTGTPEGSFGSQGRSDSRFPNSDVSAPMVIAERGFTLTDDFFGTSTDPIQDGFTHDAIQIELNGTSSAAIQNPFDETIYILNTSYLRIITATTTLVSYQMGTSTTGIVPQERSCAVSGTCATGVLGSNAGILNTASTTAVNGVANSTFFKEDYDGNVAREFLPLADDEYLTCNVSVTAATNYTFGQTGANCVFQYYRIYN